MGELTAAAELANGTLIAPSTTTNLPTSPSITTAHVLSKRHHQRPSHRACQEALSANNELLKAHDCPSQHPRVFKPRPTGWKPKRAAKRDRFQKRMRHYHPPHDAHWPTTYFTYFPTGVPHTLASFGTYLQPHLPLGTSPKFPLWSSRPHLPSVHYFGRQPSTISWLVVGYGVMRATFLDVPSISGGCLLGSMGPVVEFWAYHL